jgi:hypothetical protein
VDARLALEMHHEVIPDLERGYVVAPAFRTIGPGEWAEGQTSA